MKIALFASLLLSTSMTWANPLIMSCIVNRESVSIDVESLVSNSCESKSVIVMNGQLKTKYNINLCYGNHAEGTIEVSDAQGRWFLIDQFSTDHNCTLFRKIATSYPCRPSRYSHTGGCDR